MAVGDIHYLSDKQYIDFKTNEEEDLRATKDAELEAEIASLETLVSNIGTVNSPILTSLNSLDQKVNDIYTYVDNTLLAPITTLEYKTNVNNYLTYFPNIPANLTKTVYYLNYWNLLNSLHTKTEKSIKFLVEASGDIQGNPNFIKLKELLDITFPIFKNNVTQLVTVTNSGATTPEKSFKDLIASIKELSSSTAIQFSEDMAKKFETIADKEQTSLTGTRYFDSIQNKYYKLYVESGLIKFEETLHPLFKKYAALVSASPFSIFNISIKKTDDEILSSFSTHKSSFYRMIDNRIYSVVNNYIYIYDKTSKGLLAKIKYQPTRLYEDQYLSSERNKFESDLRGGLLPVGTENKYLTYSKTSSDFIEATDVLATQKYVPVLDGNGQTVNYNVTATYVYDYDHYYMKKCSNTLIFGSCVLNKIMGINLSYIEEKIAESQIQHSVYIDNDAWANPSIITSLKYSNRSQYMGPNFSNIVSSLYFDESNNILFLATSYNYVYSFGITNQKTSTSFDGEIIINYDFNIEIGDTYRFGSTQAEKDSYVLTGVYYDSKNKLLYGIVTTANKVKNLAYIKVDSPNTTYLATVLNIFEKNTIKVNNLNLVKDVATNSYDITLSSECSGQRNYSYIRYNTLNQFKFYNKHVAAKNAFKSLDLNNGTLYYQTARYNLDNDSIILYEGSRYIIYLFNSLPSTHLIHGVPGYEPLKRRHSIRMYDKDFGTWSYNKAVLVSDLPFNVVGSGLSQTDAGSGVIVNDSYIENIPDIKKYLDLDVKNYRSPVDDLIFIGVENVKIVNKTSFELNLLFEVNVTPSEYETDVISLSNKYLIDLSNDIGFVNETSNGDEANDETELIEATINLQVPKNADQYKNLLNVKVVLNLE